MSVAVKTIPKSRREAGQKDHDRERQDSPRVDDDH
jgi:hypothetical protein